MWLQLDERLKREGTKTHKERVEELNRYLSNLSEHHDMYAYHFYSVFVIGIRQLWRCVCYYGRDGADVLMLLRPRIGPG